MSLSDLSAMPWATAAPSVQADRSPGRAPPVPPPLRRTWSQAPCRRKSLSPPRPRRSASRRPTRPRPATCITTAGTSANMTTATRSRSARSSRAGRWACVPSIGYAHLPLAVCPWLPTTLFREKMSAPSQGALFIVRIAESGLLSGWPEHGQPWRRCRSPSACGLHAKAGRPSVRCKTFDARKIAGRSALLCDLCALPPAAHPALAWLLYHR